MTQMKSLYKLNMACELPAYNLCFCSCSPLTLTGLDAAAAAWGRDKMFCVGCLMNDKDQNKGF